MTGETDFQATLAAASQGADWAWALIYREYSPSVLRYFVGHQAPDPEDLLEEVYLQLIRNLRSFEGTEREFRSWVFMIAHNRLVDGWRRLERTRTDPMDADGLAGLSAPHDTEKDAIDRADASRTLDVIRNLTDSQRDVLFLRFFAGLTVEEVARVVGKRRGAVRALQSRAIAALRATMSEDTVSE